MRNFQRSVNLLLGASLVCTATACDFSLIPEAYAGHIHGNGGDHVRATFIKTGQAVMGYLRDTENGAALLSRHGLDAAKLEATLSIEAISVDEGRLVDNGGSAVDAIGERGSITLSKNLWSDHFEKSRDVYYLVFHEMLRSLGVNDDDYVISGALNPFPESRRVVTRIETRYPLIGEENLSSYFTADQILANGTGCPIGRLGTSLDFDAERNVVELSFRRYFGRTGGEGGARLDRKACAIAVPVKVPAGKRLVISQTDLLAKVDFKGAGNATIGFEAFLAGTRGELEKKSLVHPEGPLQGRLLLRRNDVLRSGCGGLDTLRLNTTSLLQATASDVRNALEIDRISLSLKVESCSDAGSP